MATDQTKSWTGLGLPAGTVLNSGNLNTLGNGDQMFWQAPTGSPVITTRQYGAPQGNGVEFVSTVTTELSRIDLGNSADATQDAPLIWFHMKYKVTAQPATADYTILLGRSGTTGCGNLCHNTTTPNTQALHFRNGPNANMTSTLTAAPTFSAANSRSAVQVVGDVYEVDMAVHQGASASTGRIQGRVRSISNPGTWNGGVEYYFDSGYTVQTATDLLRYYRLMKPVAGNTINSAQISEIFWGTKNAPITSLDKSVAVGNFWSAGTLTVDDGDTGPVYLIEAVGTPSAGGAISYAMQPQISGPAQTPILKGNGIWIVNQHATTPLVYDVAVTESGGGTVMQRYTVPIAAQASKQFRRRKWDGSVWA